jgi:hypothetical protein
MRDRAAAARAHTPEDPVGARSKDADLWHGGIVPYEINPDLGNIEAIHTAIKTFEQQTNVRFVGRLIQDDYIRFSKQTQGNANSRDGRVGGLQYVNASGNDVGTLLHEIAHALGMMHEHQRADRDDFVIFHADRVTEDPDQYAKLGTANFTETYDFTSLMHYNAGDPGNPIFESRTGVPIPGDIGGTGILTVTDLALLETLYPAAPVIRRTDGESGAGGVLQTSSIAVPSVNDTAILANAIQNASGRYQVVLWRIRHNGVVQRMGDPAGATGGEASLVQMVPVGQLAVSAMRNASGDLLLISHGSDFERLADSAGQAGEIRDLRLVSLNDTRVLTVCISGADRIFGIVWDIPPDGSITRWFDSGTSGPGAKSVAATVFQNDGSRQVVAILYANGSGNLVLSTWRVDAGSIVPVADSGDQMGAADFAQVVSTATGHLVVVCRDGNQNLLLIPFAVAADGSTIQRVAGGEGRAGQVREVAAVARPYGLLTAVISSGGHVLPIKWAIDAAGKITRLGEGGTQAGEGSLISVAALPFPDQATVCTVVRNGSGNLLPITWDDADGPGELSVV